MGWFDDDIPTPIVTPDMIATGMPTGIYDALFYNHEAEQADNTPSAELRNIQAIRDQNIKQLGIDNPGKTREEILAPFFRGNEFNELSFSDNEDATDLEIDAYVESRPPEERPNYVHSSGLGMAAHEFAREERIRQVESDYRAEGFGTGLAGGLGAMAAQVQEPLIAMGFAMGAPFGARILATAAIEAAFAAGFAIPEQLVVQAYREKLKLPAGVVEGLKNVALAGAGGAVFGGLLKGVLVAAGKMKNRDLAQFADDLAAAKNQAHNKETVHALDVLKRMSDETAGNPYENTPNALKAYRDQMARHTKSMVEEGKPAPLMVSGVNIKGIRAADGKPLAVGENFMEFFLVESPAIMKRFLKVRGKIDNIAKDGDPDELSQLKKEIDTILEHPGMVTTFRMTGVPGDKPTGKAPTFKKADTAEAIIRAFEKATPAQLKRFKEKVFAPSVIELQDVPLIGKPRLTKRQAKAEAKLPDDEQTLKRLEAEEVQKEGRIRETEIGAIRGNFSGGGIGPLRTYTKTELADFDEIGDPDSAIRAESEELVEDAMQKQLDAGNDPDVTTGKLEIDVDGEEVLKTMKLSKALKLMRKDREFVESMENCSAKSGEAE